MRLAVAIALLIVAIMAAVATSPASALPAMLPL